MTIKLTTRQQAAAREFQAAMTELQQRQQMYLRAILDGSDVPQECNWTLSTDCSELVEQEKPDVIPISASRN